MLITMDDKTPFIMIASQENDRNWEEMKREPRGKILNSKIFKQFKNFPKYFCITKT